MKEYKKLNFHDMCNLLANRKNTLIVYHARPDGDAMGAAFALREILGAAGIKAWCVCSDEIPQRLRFISQGIQNNATAASIPKDFNVERIVCVDSATLVQLGELPFNITDKVALMIDHHSAGTVFADNYIDSTAAATGEIIFDISREFLARKLIKRISKKINECLYASISSDTGCFKYSNVTSKTHKIAAELMKSGIDTAEINRLLFDSKSFEQLKAENAGFDAMRIYYDGKVSVICFTYEMKESLSLRDEHLETLIDVARSVAGVEVAIAIRQFKPTNLFRVSTRASGNVDVSKVCMHFGGGGHVKAAGCTITAPSIQAAADMVLEEVKKQLEN